MKRGPKSDLTRDPRICDLYSRGFTLQQIGTVFGVTRERIRQIVKRNGMTADEGGIQQRAQERRARYVAGVASRREERAARIFGCTHAELMALNDGLSGYVRGTKGRGFLDQRRNAEKRGIEWQMNFPEWCQVWRDSGHFEERGRKGDLYVMARRQDFGPYAAWNVYITTMRQNVADYQAELKRRGVECADGYKRLPESLKRINA